MAISYIGEVGKRQSHFTSAQTSVAVTVTRAPSSGNLLVLRSACTNFAVTGVTDSKGNTWTLANTAGTTASSALAYTFQNVGALTTSDTVTLAFASTGTTNLATAIDEFGGVASVDVSNKVNFATTTARSCGSVTTTNANDLIYATYAVNVNGETFTQGSGYTALPAYSAGGGGLVEVEGEYQIVSSTGTYAPTGTGSSTASGGGCVTTFQASGGGGTIGYVKQNGSVTANGSTSLGSISVPVTSPPSAGNLVLVRCVNTNFALDRVTDTQGNTWRIGEAAVSAGGVAVAGAYTFQDVAQLTNTDTITLFFTSPVFNVAAVADEFTGLQSIDQTASGTFAATNTRNAGTTSTTTQSNELLVGIFGIAGLETSLTNGASYLSPATPFLAASTAVSAALEYRVVSSTQTAAPVGTGGIAATGAGVTLTFSAAALDLTQAGGIADAYDPNVAGGATGTWTFQSDQHSGWASKGYGFTVSLAASSPGFTQTTTQTAGAFIATASTGGSFHSIDGGTSRLPLLSVSLDVTNPPTAATRTWTDITTLIRSLSFTRSGRNDEFLRTSPGTFTATVDNRGDAFTSLGAKTRQWLRIQAQWSSVTYTLWTGLVEGISHDWPEAGKDATCTLTGTDVLKIFRLYDLGAAPFPGDPDSLTFPQQRCDQRIAALLQLTGIAGKNLDPDTDTIDPDGPFSVGNDALSYALNVELSENGLLVANADGTVSFQGRHWRLLNSSSTLGTFTDAGGGGIPSETDAEYVDDDSRLANVVSVTPFGGTTPQVSYNDASRQTYWTTRNQSIDRQIMSSDTLLAQAGADWLATIYGAPSPRIPALTINLAAASAADPAFIPPLLAAENSQQFTWNRGSLTGIQGYVEQIAHSITPDLSWTMNLQLSPVVDTIGWVLGDATYGQLGNTTRLNY